MHFSVESTFTSEKRADRETVVLIFLVVFKQRIKILALFGCTLCIPSSKFKFYSSQRQTQARGLFMMNESPREMPLTNPSSPPPPTPSTPPNSLLSPGFAKRIVSVAVT